MDKNEVDSFLDGLDESPKDPLAPVVEDPLNLEEKKEETKQEEEKVLPFHKDPKIQRFIEKAVEKRLAGQKPAEPIAPAKTDDEGLDIITRIIGNDTPEKVQAGKEFKKYLDTLEDKGAKRALAELQQQADAEQQEDVQAEEELSQGFETIEEEFGVDLTSNSPQARKTRSDFIDFVTRIAPKDREGQVVQFPDFEETYRLFKDTRKVDSNSKAKELASRSMNRSGDASAVAQKGGNTWKDVEKAFSKLSDK